MDRDDKPEAEDKSTAPESGGDKPAGDSNVRDAAGSDERPDVADEPDDEPLDLESRVLCPDGACIGVIGADGRCGVCGRSASPESGKPAPAATPDAHEVSPGSVDDAEPAPDTGADDDGGLDLESRKLCSDGACIGVIGADGRCKICHKPYTNSD